MEPRTTLVDPSTVATRRVPLRTRRWIVAALVATAAAITLGPFPVGLFETTHAVVRTAAAWLPGDAGGPPTRAQTEALLNLVVPTLLVAAVAAAWPRCRPHRLLAGAVLASVSIEAFQAVVLPGRFAEIEDLVLNSGGALVGTLAVIAARRWPRA